MTLAWHDAHVLAPADFFAYEEAMFARAQSGERVLGFVCLSRCALLGAFEDPHRALRLSYIADQFPVIRRSTGGGSLSLDRDTWILVLALPNPAGSQPILAHLMADLCAPLVEVFRGYGLDAAFIAPNDIAIEGRKLASAFITQDAGATLLEVALPLALDVEEVLKTLRLPLEKLSEKGLLTARGRFAPLKSCVPDLVPSLLRSTLAHAWACALHVHAYRERPPALRSGRPIAPVPNASVADVSAFLKTTGGVLYLDVWLNGETTVREARFSGGILCADRAFFPTLQDRLVGSDIATLEETLKDVASSLMVDIVGVQLADIVYLGHLCAARFHIGQQLGLAAASQVTLFSPDRQVRTETILASIGAVLLPYCAKPVWCKWRHREGCPECGQCEVGEAYGLARDRGLQVVTITAYEHLRAVLLDLKGRGVQAFLGVCCTDFFIKRDYAFIEAGIAALFVDIAGDTCYTLRAEDDAYAGRFEAQAFLNPEVLTQVLVWRDQLLMPKEKPPSNRLEGLPESSDCPVL